MSDAKLLEDKLFQLELKWADFCSKEFEEDLRELDRLVQKTQNPQSTDGPMPDLAKWATTRDMVKTLIPPLMRGWGPQPHQGIAYGSEWPQHKSGPDCRCVVRFRHEQLHPRIPPQGHRGNTRHPQVLHRTLSMETSTEVEAVIEMLDAETRRARGQLLNELKATFTTSLEKAQSLLEESKPKPAELRDYYVISNKVPGQTSQGNLVFEVFEDHDSAWETLISKYEGKCLETRKGHPLLDRVAIPTNGEWKLYKLHKPTTPTLSYNDLQTFHTLTRHGQVCDIFSSKEKAQRLQAAFNPCPEHTSIEERKGVYLSDERIALIDWIGHLHD